MPAPWRAATSPSAASRRLKAVPSAELVDNQPVLHERSILERRGGIGAAQVVLREKSARQRAVAEQADAVARALCGHAVGRPPVEHRILQLVRDDRDTGGDDFRQALLVEVGQADVPDLAGAALLVKPGHRVDVARHVIVPPMQLHQIDAVHAEARQRAVDAADHVGPRVRGQPIEVGYVLGVHLHRRVGAGPAAPLQPLTDQRFHAGVDVRAVERRHSRVREPIHVGQRGRRVDRAVAAGQLPPAFQQA